MDQRLITWALLAGLALGLTGCQNKPKAAAAAVNVPTVAAPRHRGGLPTPATTNKAAQTTHLADHDQGELRAYYRKKYAAEERASVESMMGEILHEYSPQEKSQA